MSSNSRGEISVPTKTVHWLQQSLFGKPKIQARHAESPPFPIMFSATFHIYHPDTRVKGKVISPRVLGDIHSFMASPYSISLHNIMQRDCAKVILGLDTHTNQVNKHWFSSHADQRRPVQTLLWGNRQGPWLTSSVVTQGLHSADEPHSRGLWAQWNPSIELYPFIESWTIYYHEY